MNMAKTLTIGPVKQNKPLLLFVRNYRAARHAGASIVEALKTARVYTQSKYLIMRIGYDFSDESTPFTVEVKNRFDAVDPWEVPHD